MELLLLVADEPARGSPPNWPHVSAPRSRMILLYSENRFYRHVPSHWIEMQQAVIAMIIGGVFAFHPQLRVGFLGLRTHGRPDSCRGSSGITHNPVTRTRRTRTLTPREYFRRNCWAAVEGSEPGIEATAGLMGADRMCISTDYPHFDSNFPHVAENPSRTSRARSPRRSSWAAPISTAFTVADFTNLPTGVRYRDIVWNELAILASG